MIFPFYSHDIPIKQMPENPGHYSLAKQQGHLGDDFTIVRSFRRSEGHFSISPDAFPYGDGSKPCTPVVHIKIAGIYGCE